MFDFLINNFPTMLVGAAVAFGLAAVVWKMIKDKKNGKSSCGCDCANCPSAGACHTK